MNKKYALFFALLVVFAVVVSGCGTTSALFTEGRQYYELGVKHETSLTSGYESFMNVYNQGLLQIRDENTVALDCFTNTEDVALSAASGVFDTDRVMDEAAFVNALALNETYPDLQLCQQARIDLMRSIREWRGSNTDVINVLIDRRRVYTNFLNDDIVKRVVLELVNLNQDKLPELGIPNTFIGFPTDNLRVVTRSPELCDYYDIKESVDNMYLADWNPALGTCTLSRMAALEFMERPFIATESAARFDSGTDAGAFENIEPTAVPE